MLSEKVAQLYTKEQMNFAYAARRVPGQQDWAIYPVETLKTGKATTFKQTARHCTRADFEYLVRIA